MDEIVELRVHGVGGESADNLMGEAGNSSLTRVAGRGPDAFFARLKAPHSEGYAWGPLTSGKPAQLLWVFLLPLVLLNLAGWMVPDVTEARGKNRRWWGFARLLVAGLGFTLTVGYMLGSFAIVVKRIFYQWGLNGVFSKEDPLAIWCGSAALSGLWLVVFLTARNRQGRFEEVSQEQIGEISDAGIFETLTTRDGFEDPGFWNHLKAAKRLLWVHAGLATAAIAIATVRALKLAADDGSTLGLQVPFVWLGIVQAVLLTALFLTCLVGFKRPIHNFVRSRFRLFGPVMTSTVAVGLSAGYFALLVELTHWLIGESGSAEGPEVNLIPAFSVGALAFVVVLAFLIGFFSLRSIWRVDPSVPSDPNPMPGRELRAGRGRGKLAFARSISDIGRHLDLTLTATAVAFGLAAIPIFLIMAFGGPNSAPQPVAAIIEQATGEIPESSSEDSIDAYSESEPIAGASIGDVAGFGQWTALATAGASGLLSLGLWVLRTVRKVPKTLGTRRKIGMVWDVATAFPRRFHPLSVRPYAERAVPELQGRILHHLGQGRGVILSAHSQGTVIGFAALSQIVRRDTMDDTRLGREISFLTYGSPLTRLHAHFFPAYFNEGVFAELREGLFSDGKTPPANWRNFYRLTDYIGKEVMFSGSEQHNEAIDDPARTVITEALPRDSDWDGWPDPMRTPWVGLEWHSNYNREVVVKDWLQTVSGRMSAHTQSSSGSRNRGSGLQG